MFRLRTANSDWPTVANEMALIADQLLLLHIQGPINRTFRAVARENLFLYNRVIFS